MVVRCPPNQAAGPVTQQPGADYRATAVTSALQTVAATVQPNPRNTPAKERRVRTKWTKMHKGPNATTDASSVVSGQERAQRTWGNRRVSHRTSTHGNTILAAICSAVAQTTGTACRKSLPGLRRPSSQGQRACANPAEAVFCARTFLLFGPKSRKELPASRAIVEGVGLTVEPIGPACSRKLCARVLLVSP
jgi:hypothetical protein